jgi:CheY-like chemotaxis protein
MASILRTIFVVDDSDIVLSVTRKILEEAGYRVVTQSRAARCLSQIQLERPALVLLDVNMPDLPGSAMSELCRRAREAGATVVLFSSLDVKSLRRLVSVSGADNFIQKTENATLLVRQVARLIGESGAPPSGKTVDAERGDLRHSGTHRKSTEGRKTHVLLVDNDMASLSAMREMVQRLGFDCEFALSTKQALGKLESARPPDVVVACDSLPHSGVIRLYEAAVLLHSSWSRRFVITAGNETASCRPAGYAGPIVTKPIADTSLQAAIEQLLPAGSGANVLVQAQSTKRS